MALKARIAKLEQHRPEPVDTAAHDARMAVLKGELRARGVDPEVVIRNGRVDVFGDTDQYVGTLQAVRATEAILAGLPVPWDCFPDDDDDEPDEPLWIKYGL
jgi:hypothetical protein